MPLLIGGATTSRVHTAVKITPNYERGQTIYVTDASRAVGVVSSLHVRHRQRDRYMDNVRKEYVKIRDAYLQGREPSKTRMPLAGRARQPLQDRLVGLCAAQAEASSARARSRATSWRNWCPTSTGRRSSRPGSWSASTRASSRTTWSGAEAKKLFDDAQAMLKRIVAEKWLTANAVVGFWPANATGDDIELYSDDTRKTRLRDAAHAAPADGPREPARPRQYGARRFHGAQGDGAGRLHRRLRRHHRHRRGRGARPPYRQDRRLLGASC